ncbi:hypothetical protein [Marinospirillum alkaliphilum]|uniref:hypothetical protein n=1 Tax=Marinospirillum alkaliphilum TaxID=148454 RepID=UPI001160C22A|nr:hypothetical protein [Marinospirillum alkaliphilum]
MLDRLDHVSRFTLSGIKHILPAARKQTVIFIVLQQARRTAAPSSRAAAKITPTDIGQSELEIGKVAELQKRQDLHWRIFPDLKQWANESGAC